MIAAIFMVSFIGVACSSKDGKVPDVRRTSVDVPDTSPGDDPLSDDLQAVVERHLEVDFGSKGWLKDVGDITKDGFTVTVNFNRDFSADEQDFDGLCTAVAGLVISSPHYAGEQVIVKDKDGTPVIRSREGVPQCLPIAH